jgi:hypothetical protein
MHSILIVICLSIWAIFSQNNALSGPVYGVLGPGVFRVAGDLQVPPGETLLLRAGTTLCFDGFYSLTVNGGLIAEGSLQNRVVLTSAKSPRCGDNTAEPMDWNHVEVSASATQVQLENTDILFSTDGILSAKSGVTLKGVLLEKNGLNRVILAGAELHPDSQGIFSCAPAVVLPKQAAPPSAAGPEKGAPAVSGRKPYYIAGGIAAVVIGAACLYLILRDKEPGGPGIIPDPPPPSRNN